MNDKELVKRFQDFRKKIEMLEEQIKNEYWIYGQLADIESRLKTLEAHLKQLDEFKAVRST